MQKKYFSWIKNPMTIIALFIGLTEIAIGAALGSVPIEIRYVLSWLLLIIPTFSLIGFFLILFYHPQNFYGPSDFTNDSNYLSLFKGINIIPEKPVSEGHKSKKRHSKINLHEQISQLPIDFCYFLLKSSDKQLEMADLIKILSNEMTILKEKHEGMLADIIYRIVALGYFIFAIETVSDDIFVLQKDNGEYILKLKDGVRDLLSKRISTAKILPPNQRLKLTG